MRPARARVSVTRLGLNALTWRLLVLQGVMLLAGQWLFRVTGLALVWSSVFPGAWLLIALIACWAYFWFEPGTSSDWVLAESLIVIVLILLLGIVAGPAQYATVALKWPVRDALLARADAAMGVDVPTLTAWTRGHPALTRVLVFCYSTFTAQIFLVPVGLGLILRERSALWEYAFHFHVCLAVCLVMLALVPTEFSFTYYRLTPLMGVTHVTHQFEALRAGTLTSIRFDDLDGMISFPSFHVAVGLIVTWAFRQRWWTVVPLIVVNVGATAATFLTGVHYVVDSIGSVVLVTISVLVWRRLARLWLTP
jgi:PAP2 superfamily